MNICTILNYNIEKLSTSDFYSYFVTIKNIVGLKQTNGVEAQVAGVDHDFCDCGDVKPEKNIQSVLMDLSKEVSELANIPNATGVSDVKKSTKVD